MAIGDSLTTPVRPNASPHMRADAQAIPIASAVNWGKCRLTQGGWTYAQGEDGFTLSCVLYSADQSAFPRRGDHLPASGPCAPSPAFANYVVSEIEIEPLTSAGPWQCRVSARPSILNRDATGSKRRERTASLCVQRIAVRADRLVGASWSGKREIPCRVSQCTWNRTAATSDGVPPQHGIVTGLPSWTGASSGTWVLREARAEHIKDTNGVTNLRRVTAVFYRPCDYEWNASSFNRLPFSSI